MSGFAPPPSEPDRQEPQYVLISRALATIDRYEREGITEAEAEKFLSWLDGGDTDES